MADFRGFQFPNYTQAPNEFFDDLLPQITELSELKITLVILRQTFGFHRRKFKLSKRDFKFYSGLRTEESVERGIALAVDRGTIRVSAQASHHSPKEYELCILDESGAPMALGERRSKKPKPAEKKEADGKSVVEMAKALCEVCKVDMQLMGGQVGKTAKGLVSAGYTPEMILACFCDQNGWWRTKDFRGKQNISPTLQNVTQFAAMAKNGAGSGGKIIIQD